MNFCPNNNLSEEKGDKMQQETAALSREGGYLEVKNVFKTYHLPGQETGNVAVPTLEDISFNVNKGEFISIIGPSGCGKSTLFNLISGLELPDKGKIVLDGEDITGRKGHVSYMLQKDLLLPWRTVLENCIIGLELQKIPRTQAISRASALLSEFNLSEFAGSYPSTLSGGMRQRVAFLRTMLADRELLLLDEPFGALDAYTKSEMHAWLADILTKIGRPTILFITHDVEEALLLSDRIYLLGPRPASIKLQLSVELQRPRTRQLIVGKEFIEMKRILMESLFKKIY